MEIQDKSDNGRQANDIEYMADFGLLVKRLSFDEAAAVKMRLEGYNDKEIAEQLHLSQYKVRQIFERARKKLSQESHKT
jgi:RNA polymerase sigma factor (sigma-70 family)